jgi:hypothetical protein
MFESTRRKIERMIFSQITIAISDHFERCHLKPTPPKQYTCETCGCLIAPEFAVAGEKEIRQKKFYVEDYIYTPHYCKACAPKGKK